MILESSSTQTPPLPTKTDIGVQCYNEIDICNEQLSEKKIQEAEKQAEESEDYQDSDFHVSDVSDVDEPCEETVHSTNDVQEPDKAAFIVYCTSLLVLLQRCLHLACVLPAAITNIAFKGSQLIVKIKCQSGHTNTWKSQPTCNNYSVDNLTCAAAVLFSANTYQRIASFFDTANIQCLSKTSCYVIQKRYLTGIVNKNYIQMSKSILEGLKEKGPCYLSRNGRCDSPGHNAKYLTYYFMDKNTIKIAAFSLTQVSEAGNSNRMEKMGLRLKSH